MLEGVRSAGFETEYIDEFPVKLDHVLEYPDAEAFLVPAIDLQVSLDTCRMLKELNSNIFLLLYSPEVRSELRLRFLQAGADEHACCSEVPQRLLKFCRPFWSAHDDEEPEVQEIVEPESQLVATPDGQDVFLKLHLGELANALQFLTLSPRTGKAEIEFLDCDETGEVFLNEGRPVHAHFQDSDGIEAFALMLVAHNGRLWFREGIVPEKKSIEKSIDGLLLEATVLADEMLAVTKMISMLDVPIKQKGHADVSELDEESGFLYNQIDGFLPVYLLLAAAGMGEIRGKLILANLQQLGFIEFRGTQ